MNKYFHKIKKKLTRAEHSENRIVKFIDNNLYQ